MNDGATPVGLAAAFATSRNSDVAVKAGAPLLACVVSDLNSDAGELAAALWVYRNSGTIVLRLSETAIAAETTKAQIRCKQNNLVENQTAETPQPKMHKPPLRQQKLRKQYSTDNLQWAELEIESAGSRTQDCKRSCKRSLADGPPDRKSRKDPSDRRTVETQQQELYFRPPVAG